MKGEILKCIKTHPKSGITLGHLYINAGGSGPATIFIWNDNGSVGLYGRNHFKIVVSP